MNFSLYFSIFLISCVSATTSFAQKDKKSSSGGGEGYKTGLGVRGGYEGGITVKHFIKETAAIEGIFTTGYRNSIYGNRSLRITGLYEIQKPLPNADGFNYFYGIGAHVGSYSYYEYGYYGDNGSGYYDKHGKWHSGGSYKKNYISVGLDAILGLEYQFTELPFTVGVDVKPYFDIFNGRGSYFDLAFSLRYVFK
jgi:hypothetical protein